jgi:hypothetical protein
MDTKRPSSKHLNERALCFPKYLPLVKALGTINTMKIGAALSGKVS